MICTGRRANEIFRNGPHAETTPWTGHRRPARHVDTAAFARRCAAMLLAAIVGLLPGAGLAEPAPDAASARQPVRQIVELRVQMQSEKILDQIKGAVCGTGPIFAGTVDDPVFVTPRLRPACTISMTRPGSP